MSSSGAQGNDISDGDPAVSADGRYVAFGSAASNLVPADTNGAGDVFVRDVATGKTRRVSVSSTGAQANVGGGGRPAISGNGRYVAFVASSDNLVPGDTNNELDVFVHDVFTGRTKRASVSSTGAQANEGGDNPAISANGRYVAFLSHASDLVPGDTNSTFDVFVRDMATGKTRRVSLSSAGAQANSGGTTGPAISADGRYVAFASYASNLVPGDTNGWADVFVRDVLTSRTRRVNLSSTGAQANGGQDSRPAISADGRYVAFNSGATNLVPADTNNTSDVFLRDVLTGRTRRVSVSSHGAQTPDTSNSYGPSISANGRYVAFYSSASNLVPADTNDSYDVFVRDVLTGRTRRVSVNSAGAQGDGPSLYHAISADGRYVAFHSFATNLAPGDTNNLPDIFRRDIVR